MNLRETDIPNVMSDLGVAVVDALPVDAVAGAIHDMPLPDLEAVANVAIDLGRSGSKGVVRVVRVARCHPYRAALVVSSVLAVVLALAIVERRRRGDSDESPQLTVADAA
jgi:hypothetical protein